MDDRPISFRSILDPVTPEEFFAEYFDKKPLHVPGPDDKFTHVFSWQELNELLEAKTLWSENTFKIVLDGEDIDYGEFSSSGQTRDGHQGLLPNPNKVHEYLRQGATLVLDRTERLTPEAGKIADIIELATGAPSNCNIYCSWQAHKGFKSHYDTMDVFVFHVDGHKVWNVYEGRQENPIATTGFDFLSFPAEHHDRVKGPLMMEVEMTPGDFLYLPPGQYHDALATSDASLHLTFGSIRPTGLDFVDILVRSLAEVSEFREFLPNFDDIPAHRAHLRRIADKLAELAASETASEQMREYQRERAHRFLSPGFNLPVREQDTLFRVRGLGAKLVRDGDAWRLERGGGGDRLTADEGRVAEWVMARDSFTTSTYAEAFGEDSGVDLLSALQRLAELGLIAPL